MLKTNPVIYIAYDIISSYRGWRILWNIIFYEKGNGTAPVREFIEKLTPKHHARAFRGIDVLRDYGTARKEPCVKHIKGKLWDSQEVTHRGYSTSFLLAMISYCSTLCEETPKNTPSRDEESNQIFGGLPKEERTMNYEEYKQAALAADPELRKEYEALALSYEMIDAVLAARTEKPLTQAQLAKRAGTKQSDISRFESGNYNSSVEFLEKIAKALDEKPEIKFI